MSDKALKKKQLIIEKSRDVFARKGYRAVTMKDLVEACGISRGGLYLYFDCVEAVFKGVIESESKKGDPDIIGMMPSNPGTIDYLKLFFHEQKRDILRGGDSLLSAMYEYSFEKNVEESEEQTLIASQFDKSVSFLTALIKKGNELSDVNCEDPADFAMSVMISLEGMRVLSRCMTLSEQTVNTRISALLAPILPKQQ